MKCSECNQLWKVDAWDKYQTLYAAKIPSQENWEDFNIENQIKEIIINNHGGLTQDKCHWAGCTINQVNGSALCVNHLFESGTRA